MAGNVHRMEVGQSLGCIETSSLFEAIFVFVVGLEED